MLAYFQTYASLLELHQYLKMKQQRSENYRFISIDSNISKTIKKLMHIRLNQVLESQNRYYLFRFVLSLRFSIKFSNVNSGKSTKLDYVLNFLQSVFL